MKVIAMIPARYGSKRVPQKNLRMICGKPLISYAIEAAKLAECFDEIYVNSEHEIFQSIAIENGVKYYKRPPQYASDLAINDDFAFDFISNVSGDILVQILPTSPLISPDEIKSFVAEMKNGEWDTLVSVENHQIASLFEGRPVNYKLMEGHISSQNMVPVQTYATVLMSWTYQSFKDHMSRLGYAYHGADGRVGYFNISGLSTIDIDNEEDFQLAEVALEYVKNKNKKNLKPIYYQGSLKNIGSESNVLSILKKDGVIDQDFSAENQPITNLKKLIMDKDNEKSWSHRLINTENNSATLISQLPGEGNRLHYHDSWNEWWYILKGEWEWLIDGEKFIVREGDLVFIEKNKMHKITAIGSKNAIRLAVSRDEVAHIYMEE